MAAKRTTPKKRTAKTNGRVSTSGAEYKRLQKELKVLREENRQLRKSLCAVIFKDEPRNMDLKPEDGVFDPPLTELIAEIERAG
jgi:transposase-like protein